MKEVVGLEQVRRECVNRESGGVSSAFWGMFPKGTRHQTIDRKIHFSICL